MSVITTIPPAEENPDDRSRPEPTVTPRKKSNLLQLWDESPALMAAVPQLVRLDRNDTIIVPFTPEVDEVSIHYCDETEVRRYVPCNGERCVLCQIGNQVENRFLLPVYVPTTRSIAVLPISPSARPGALRPQIMPILRDRRRVAVSIRRLDQVGFVVKSIPLREGMDDGATVIKAFVKQWDNQEIDLTKVYSPIENADLAALPGIATTLAYKEIEGHDAD